jgi:uncharacterized protein (TIRG00374 family)
MLAMKRLNTILLALGLVFLAYLLWKVGPGELWKQFSALGWGVSLLILAEGAANVAHTVGWRHCIHDLHGRVSLPRLFRICMAGYSINYLTPTASVGGELSRAALLADTYKGSQAVSSVLLDKLMTAVAHLVLVVLGAVFLFWRVSLPVELWVAMAVTTGLLTTGIVGFLLLQKFGKLGALCRWLVERKLGGRSVEQAAEQISKVDEALKGFYHEHPKDLVLSVVWHFVGHAVAILHAWLFLWLVGQPAPVATVITAGLLSLWFDLLTFAIPLNLGTLEGSRILVFKALGCEGLLGMAFGVAVRIAQVFWACFGLASYVWLATRQAGAAAGRPWTSLARVATRATELQQGISGQRTSDPSDAIR